MRNYIIIVDRVGTVFSRRVRAFASGSVHFAVGCSNDVSHKVFGQERSVQIARHFVDVVQKVLIWSGLFNFRYLSTVFGYRSRQVCHIAIAETPISLRGEHNNEHIRSY